MKQFKIDELNTLFYKENNRLKPAHKKDYAKLTIKKLTCPNCGYEEEVKRVVFGEDLKCPKCKVVMIEQY